MLDDAFVSFVSISSNNDDPLSMIDLVRIITTKLDIVGCATFSKGGYEWTVVKFDVSLLNGCLLIIVNDMMVGVNVTYL
jgi:hypothetical protein